MLCQGAWFDGIVNKRERELLNFKRRELGLTKSQADKIEEKHADKDMLAFINILEQAKADGKISSNDTDMIELMRKELNIDQKAKDLGIDAWRRDEFIKEYIKSFS